MDGYATKATTTKGSAAGDPLPEVIHVHFAAPPLRERHLGDIRVSSPEVRFSTPFLTDQSYAGGDYRFHDALHLAALAILGWSPVLRRITTSKRLSGRERSIEEGSRAAVIEEAALLLLHSYLRDGSTPSADTLERLCREIASVTPSRQCPVKLLHAAREGGRIFRGLAMAGGGSVVVDRGSGTVALAPLAPELVLASGKAGSGKSQFAATHYRGYAILSRDEGDLSEDSYFGLLEAALARRENIYVDRTAVRRSFRQRVVAAARRHGYRTRLVEFDVDPREAERRVLSRRGHQTLTPHHNVRAVLAFYDSIRDPASDEEADIVERISVPRQERSTATCPLVPTASPTWCLSAPVRPHEVIPAARQMELLMDLGILFPVGEPEWELLRLLSLSLAPELPDSVSSTEAFLRSFDAQISETDRRAIGRLSAISKERRRKLIAYLLSLPENIAAPEHHADSAIPENSPFGAS